MKRLRRTLFKYKEYEKAIRLALQDAKVSGCDRPINLAVVGAGRGPLVAAALAADRSVPGIDLNVFAVEKNTNAIITLRHRIASEGGGWGRVSLVHTDMRDWEPPKGGIDILVSELLGSFGDNELSPECLDGAVDAAFKGDTSMRISIPSDYTSFVAPITSAKLWNAAISLPGSTLKSLETPYVVKMVSMHAIADSVPCFRFEHPGSPPSPHGGGRDNSRYKVLRWRVPESGSTVVHGFAGYFESTLYKSAVMSINPPTHSEGMFSWFPLYFPIRNPFSAPAGSEIVFHIWRKVSASAIWYEWSVESPVLTPIHNPGGRSYKIGTA